MKNKVQGIVMLLAGAALLTWGYSISQSLTAQIGEIIGGAPPTRSIYMIALGALSASFGFFKLFKLR